MDTYLGQNFHQKPPQKLSDVLQIFSVILFNKETLLPQQICKRIKLFEQCQDQSLKNDFLSGVESLLNFQKNKFNQFSLLFEKAKESQQKIKHMKRAQMFTNILRQLGDEKINMIKILHEVESSQLFDQNFKNNVQKIGSRLVSAQKCEQILKSVQLSLKPQQLLQFFDYIYDINKFLEATLSESIKDFQKIQKYYAINYLTYLRHLIDLLNRKINETKQGSKDRILHEKQEEQKYQQRRRSQIQLEQLKKQHQNMANKLQEDLKFLSLEKDQLVIDLAEQKRLNIAINTQRQSLKQLNKKIQQEKEKQFTSFEKIVSQKQQLSQIITKLQTQIQQLNGSNIQLMNLKQKLHTFQKQNNQQKLKISHLEKEMIQKQKKREENYKKLLEAKNQQHQKEMKINQSNKQKLQNELKTKDINIGKMEQKITHYEHQISQKNDQRKILEQKNHELGSKVKQYEDQFQQQMSASKLIKINLESKNSKINQYETMINQFKNLSYFFGPIFTSQLEKTLKQDLIGQISKCTGRDIISTQRIYALDKKNPVSPHKYIDGVPDWVLLFKLRNGYIIGGFCRDPITPVKKEDFVHQGFMFSLNAKKFYTLPNNIGKTTIYQYQQFYLIIGNSEIRFNLQTHLVENQFGGKFKYFETGNDKVENFFGSKDEKFQIETYEFYHLIFQ